MAESQLVLVLFYTKYLAGELECPGVWVLSWQAFDFKGCQKHTSFCI